MSECHGDPPTEGIDRFEVALVAIYTCGLSTFLIAARGEIGPIWIPEEVRGAPFVLGLVAGTFLVLLGLAARTPLRQRLGSQALVLCAISGFVTGVIATHFV